MAAVKRNEMGGTHARDFLDEGKKDTFIKKGYNNKRKKCTLVYLSSLNAELVADILKGK